MDITRKLGAVTAIFAILRGAQARDGQYLTPRAASGTQVKVRHDVPPRSRPAMNCCPLVVATIKFRSFFRMRRSLLFQHAPS